MGSQANWLRCQQKRPKICLLRYLHDNMHKRDRWSKKTIAFPCCRCGNVWSSNEIMSATFFQIYCMYHIAKGDFMAFADCEKNTGARKNVRMYCYMFQRVASNSERTIMRVAHCFRKAFDINLHLIESCYWSVSCTQKSTDFHAGFVCRKTCGKS